MARRLWPTFLVLGAGFAGLVVFLVALEWVFLDERAASARDAAERLRAVQHSAEVSLRGLVETAWREADARLSAVEEDPLRDATGLVLIEEGRVELPPPPGAPGEGTLAAAWAALARAPAAEGSTKPVAPSGGTARGARPAAGESAVSGVPVSPSPSALRGARAVEGRTPRLPAGDLPRSQEARSDDAEENPRLERQRLLWAVDQTLTAGRPKDIEASVRAFLGHRARYVLAPSDDLPPVLRLVEWLTTRTHASPDLLRLILRDGVTGAAPVEGLQRAVLRRWNALPEADQRWACAKVEALSAAAGVTGEDFAARCRERLRASDDPAVQRRLTRSEAGRVLAMRATPGAAAGERGTPDAPPGARRFDPAAPSGRPRPGAESEGCEQCGPSTALRSARGERRVQGRLNDAEDEPSTALRSARGERRVQGRLNDAEDEPSTALRSARGERSSADASVHLAQPSGGLPSRAEGGTPDGSSRSAAVLPDGALLVQEGAETWAVVVSGRGGRGVVVSERGLVGTVEQQLRQHGLLESGGSVALASSSARTAWKDLRLEVRSPAAAAAEEARERAFRLKTTLLAVCLALGAGIVVAAVLAQRRKQRLVEMKSDFVSTVSHELRTPLASLRVMAETLELKLAGVEAAKDYPSRMVREVEGLAFLAENLLSFNRLDKGRWTPRLEATTLAVLGPWLEQEAKAYTAARVELTCVGLDVPLRADPELLRLLFQNLLRNASRYNARDPVVVRVAAALEGAKVRVTVADNGVGVPREAWATVFEAFERLRPSTGRGGGGSGLGLALCRRIARLHGGDVRIVASSPEGSSFEVTLARG